MITPYVDPIVGGISTFVRELAAALRQRGLNIAVIALSGGAAEDVHIVGGRHVRFSLRAAQIATQLNPDAIHAHAHWYALRAGSLVRRRSNCRLVFTFHTAPRGLGPVRRWALRHMLLDCNAVTFPSEYSRSQLDLNLPEGVSRVVHPGVPVRNRLGSRGASENIRQVSRNERVTLGYVGNFDWPEKVRGFQLLVRSLDRPKLRDVRLLVAGGGPLLPEVMQEARHLGVSDRIVFLGKVLDPDVVYRESQIYCHPSLQEGMSLAILEAMSAGLPIVAIRAGFAPELIRDGVDGLLADPNVESLAETIAQIRENPALANRLGTNARMRAAGEFNWERTAEEFIKLYGWSE